MSDLHKKIRNQRYDYSKSDLDEKDVDKNPFLQFEKWFEEAMEARQPDANAFILATGAGIPSARVLLLRGFTEQGFEFFTNYNSRKAADMEQNPNACILFFWNTLQRQVRIEGKVEKVSEKVSDEYFQSRPRESRIGAWASSQSKSIPSRDFLEEQVKKFSEKYPGENVPRPPNWGGYLLKPEAFEFWQGRSNRLHDRILYSFVSGNWKIERLAP